MKIAIAGTGYVGLANAVLLSQHNEVVTVDIVQEKVDLLNKGISPIEDSEINLYLESGNLNLRATTDWKDAYTGADFVIIATPTDYDEKSGYFNTKSIESVIENVLEVNSHCGIVIKSTIPVGYTEKVRKQFDTNRIIFSPEFLREGKALYDNLYPSRIVIGGTGYLASQFSDLLVQGAIKKDCKIIFTNPTEAESIKMFANTYLAMRVAFFNELDMFAECLNLNTKSIIDGVGLDPRIGTHYNNPSFGYGGYCFPKDTKQMLANYQTCGVPQALISAIIKSNKIRKEFVADGILSNSSIETVGIYRLTMKSGSDNFRSSAIQDIIKDLSEFGFDILIYEPTLTVDTYDGHKVIHDLEEFKIKSDKILANRITEELMDYEDKVYSRDIYHLD